MAGCISDTASFGGKLEEAPLLTFVPSFFGAETLYSWSARYHLLSGNKQPTKSSEDLFQSRQAGLRHDFPFQLSRLSKTTGGLLGPARAILNERTMFGFFAPFLETKVREKIATQMLGDQVSDLKRSLGLMSSRIDAKHPLKACWHCVKEDIKRYGVPTWKMEHQWPSVWICKIHGAHLKAVDGQLMPRDPRKWILPDDLSAKDWLPTRQKRKLMAKLLHLANVSIDVAEKFRNGMDPNLLRTAYLLGLRAKGLLATDGSIKFQRFRESFAAMYSGLSDVPGFGIVSGSEREHGGFLGLLTRQYHGRRHPLKHLLLIAFLFSTAKEFWAVYQDLHADNEALADRDGWRSRKINQEWKVQLRRLVEIENLSVSAAARNLGVPLPQAIRFVRAEGIPYEKKPPVLTPEVKKALHGLALRGLSYSEMAATLQIKKSLARSFLASEVALRATWHQVRGTATASRQARKIVGTEL
jgi:hypothetical protein